VKRYGEAEKFLADTIGLDPEVMGPRVIKNEVDSLMQDLGTDDVERCVRELSLSEEKLGTFIEKIVVPETWFFRDKECFKFLKRYARDVVSGKGSCPVRVLSAPCSTGEEPYSIAITLCEAGFAPTDILIDAVDISRKALKIARGAEYGRASFRGETKYYEDRYFAPAGDGLRVNPEIAGLVHYHHANILGKGFFTDREPYHIIFCKNLLIYLNPEARRTLLAGLKGLLVDGGILFTGHSELASFLQKGFEAVAHPRSFACVKSEPAHRADTPSLPSVPTGRKRPRQPAPARLAEVSSPTRMPRTARRRPPSRSMSSSLAVRPGPKQSFKAF